MPWVEIEAEEYSKLFGEWDDNLSVYSSATVNAPGYLGERYFAEDYFFTEWVLKGQNSPCLKEVKDKGKWKHWKWEGPMPAEEDQP